MAKKKVRATRKSIANEVKKSADAQQPRLKGEKEAKKRRQTENQAALAEEMKVRAAKISEKLIKQARKKAEDEGVYAIFVQVETGGEGGYMIPNFVGELLRDAGFRIFFHGDVYKHSLFFGDKSYKRIEINWWI